MVLGLAFSVMGALMPKTASASDFRLRIDDLSGQGVVITDDGAGDEAPGVGLMSLNLTGVGGNATTSMTLAYSKPSVEDGSAMWELFLNSVTLVSTGPAHLTLTLEDRNYTGSGPLQLTSHVLDNFFSSAPGSTVQITSWVNTSNNAPVLGADQSTPGALAAITGVGGLTTGTQTLLPGSAVPADQSVTFNAAGPFSLFTQVVFDIVGTDGGVLSFDQDAKVTSAPGELGGPEPASLMLIGSGLLGLLGARRRFSATQA
jgi:hypothetical protein